VQTLKPVIQSPPSATYGDRRVTLPTLPAGYVTITKEQQHQQQQQQQQQYGGGCNTKPKMLKNSNSPVKSVCNTHVLLAFVDLTTKVMTTNESTKNFKLMSTTGVTQQNCTSI
jgi:hypothetical protein